MDKPLPPSKQNCTCKFLNFLHTGQCYKSLNITWQENGPEHCKVGCDKGQRPYYTGGSFTCKDSNESYSALYFTLFETACQGTFHGSHRDITVEVLFVTVYVYAD